ncbi:MAG: pyridoxal-phosphate dependent enzyme [Cyclobacteriaceae bacterium]|nr:pyridoxal-phosphate dependent enzyme [Cyclobacteriaceae bacterium]
MFHLIKRTPYKTFDNLDRPDIFIKLECNQFGNSFKARGVINFLQHTDKTNGLVTFTTGNHGIAVAAIAKELGIQAIIISSHKLSNYKKALIESYGATVLLIDNYNLDQATEYAKLIASEKDFTFVPLFDNEYLLEGYSEIAKEIIDDFEGVLTIYFPIGSGSLLFANSKFVKSFNSNNKVIGVEPQIYQRLNGLKEHNSSSTSIADSLSIDRIPNSNLELLKFTNTIETLEENEIANATRLIYEQFNLITEPGGAISLAAALKTRKDETKKIAVITGKNISPEKFNSLIQS